MVEKSKKSKKTVDYVERSSKGVTMRLYFGDKGKYGSIKFDGFDFAVKINVWDSDNGYFVSYPSVEYDGRYIDLAFPTSKEMRDVINKLAVKCIDEYYE